MTALLQLHSVVKSFGAVRALKGVSFDLQAGEVHALLGENGAGKSTLIKIITGAHQPDAGTIEIAAQPIRHLTPASAHKLGIACIYQQPALFPDFISGRDPINPGIDDPNRPGYYQFGLLEGGALAGNWWVFIVDEGLCNNDSAFKRLGKMVLFINKEISDEGCLASILLIKFSLRSISNMFFNVEFIFSIGASRYS
jgi:ABC-type Fe3+/spermidine/putrescine transport system ATPase subunit